MALDLSIPCSLISCETLNQPRSGVIHLLKLSTQYWRYLRRENDRKGMGMLLFVSLLFVLLFILFQMK